MLSNCRDFHVHMCCCCLGHYVDSLPANNQSLLMSGQYCLDCKYLQKQGEFQSQKSCLQILYSIYIWRYLFIAIIYHISCLLMSTYLLLLQYETCFMLTQWFPGQNWVCVCVPVCARARARVCVRAQHMEDDKRANREPRHGHLSGFWDNLLARVWMLVEKMGGYVSVMCLTGSCIGCHVAQQPKQRSNEPQGPNRGQRLP